MDATPRKPRGGAYQIMGARACELMEKGWTCDVIRRILVEEYGNYYEIGWKGPHRNTLAQWWKRHEGETNTC